MRKKVLRITGIYIAVMCMLFLGGCSGSQGRENGQAVQNKTGSGQGSKDEKTQRQKQLEDEKAEKAAAIREKTAVIKEKDAEREAVIKEKAAVIREKDEEIAELKKQLEAVRQG